MTWGSTLWGVVGSEGLTYPLSSSQVHTGLGAWKDTGISVGSCCEGEAEETPAGRPAHGTLQVTASPPSGAGPRALQILQAPLLPFVGLGDLVLWAWAEGPHCVFLAFSQCPGDSLCCLLWKPRRSWHLSCCLRSAWNCPWPFPGPSMTAKATEDLEVSLKAKCGGNLS